MFLLQKAENFLSISLSIWLPSDRLIWSKTPSSKFTTKSAYRLLACNASANNPSNSNLSPQNSFWRGLWKLRVLNKVKHFAWRVCNEALPTMVNLARQQVGTIDQCNSCNSRPEDVGWFVGRSHSNNQIATKTQFWTFGSTKKVYLFFITQTQTFKFLSFEWWNNTKKESQTNFFFVGPTIFGLCVMEIELYNSVSTQYKQPLSPCLDFFFLSFKFCHSSLITYHSSFITLKYHVCLVSSLTFHHSIFFTLFVGPIPVTRCSFFFFSSVPKLTEPSEKKKNEDWTSERRRKKKKKKPQNKPNQWKKKKEKKRTKQPTQEKKGKKNKSKGAAEYCLWVLMCV